MTNPPTENAAAPKAGPRWGVILVWVGVLGLLALVGVAACSGFLRGDGC